MLGKLVKYEFKSLSKILGIIWIIIPVLSILYGIGGRVIYRDGYGGYVNSEIIELVASVSVTFYAALFMAMAAVTVVIIIMRFYKGVLGNEGYLVHTLPVKPWQVVTSKGIVATVTVIISAAVALLSIYIMSIIISPQGMFTWTNNLFPELFKDATRVAYAIEFLLWMLFSTVATIYQAYAAMSLGQIANKNRVLWSIGAYLLIDIVSYTISFALAILGSSSCGLMGFGIFTPIVIGSFDFLNMELSDKVLLIMLMIIVVQLVKIAIFHTITNHVIKHRLNLE